MANRIFRSARGNPRTITDRAVAGAYLPGTAVFVGASTLTQATAASGGRLALLGDQDFCSLFSFAFSIIEPLMTPYTSGQNGVAYLLKPGDEVLWAMAAGTYATGQELTISSGGRLAAAVSGNIVVAHYDQGSATVPAGYLADVCVANRYTKA
ncbi:hypothetical protein [Rhodoferax fermentans]|uniref:Uncharacterized protein n=1 Tax=Rhodoferax fermentans TaxID=28066 RepID=A0A1T1ANH4_RHOFE|nr:hypothetical protein [Rhodoferax fermentans]MBK1685525.1 hypothetical protein [Rhodoferax fermentans]OOV05649.1 hypothetical protein RF819_02025 [Rhodoferax fermentans]